MHLGNIESNTSHFTIEKILVDAYFAALIDDDGDIYIRDGLEFPSWVSNLKQPGVLKFFTCIQLDDCSSGASNLCELSAQLNSEIILATFFPRGGKLWATYFLPTGDGVSNALFVQTLRRFSSAFAFAIRRAEQILAVPLSATNCCRLDS